MVGCSDNKRGFVSGSQDPVYFCWKPCHCCQWAERSPHTQSAVCSHTLCHGHVQLLSLPLQKRDREDHIHRWCYLGVCIAVLMAGPFPHSLAAQPQGSHPSRASSTTASPCVAPQTPSKAMLKVSKGQKPAGRNQTQHQAMPSWPAIERRAEAAQDQLAGMAFLA